MIELFNQSTNTTLLSNEFMQLRQIANQSSLGFLIDYSKNLPEVAMKGDMLAIILMFIAFFVMIVVINKITSMLIAVIQRIFIFIITGIAVFYFSRYTMAQMATGLTPQIVLLAAAGFSIGTVGLIIAGIALYRMIQRARGYYAEELPKLEEEEEPDEEKARVKTVVKKEVKKDVRKEIAKEKKHEMERFKDMLSMEHIRRDRSLLSIMTFIVVAEFGVFSTKTVSAPNTEVGLSMSIVFIVACFVFIRQSYSSYWRGVFHMMVALLFGAGLSIILGLAWGEIPLHTLLSLDYFSTNSLVAVISGMALSLFAASKN